MAIGNSFVFFDGGVLPDDRARRADSEMLVRIGQMKKS
jgi:hypothetical protein